MAGLFEKGPVKEHKMKSPLVIKNSKSKVVFEEYFKERKPDYEPYYLGNEITGFKLFDPSTGEVMLDVEMRDGMLSREIQGTAKDKAKVKEVPVSTDVFEVYTSEDSTLIFSMGRDGDKILGYNVIEDVGQRTSRLLWIIGFEDGKLRRTSQTIYSADTPQKVLKRNYEGEYSDMTYFDEGAYVERIFKKGFLAKEIRQSRESAIYALYHYGRLGFWTKQTLKDAKKGILEVYDENDELVDTVKISFGEYYEIKFDDRDGKSVKIFRKTRGKKIVNEVIREMD
jgi:hypothetical protein